MVGKETAERILDCELVLQDVPLPLLVLDASGRVMLANRSFCETFGYFSEDLAGKQIWQFGLGAPWNRPELRHLLSDLDETGRSTTDAQFEDDVPRLGRRSLIFTARRLPENSGSTPLTLLTIQGATGTANAIRRAQDAVEELRRSNDTLSNFSSMAAHDLQAPLRRIAHGAELAADALKLKSPDLAVEQLASIRSQAQNMMMLIQDLLRFAESGSEAGLIEDVPLTSVLTEVLDILDEPLKACGARIERTGLPIVRGRRSQLRQLFLNLIDNAIRYRKPDTAPVIEIDVAPALNGIQVSVRDNAMGFDPEKAEEIFKPFRRLNASGQPGTGLGLAICRRTMDALGGAIWAMSEPGVGTTFTLHFPTSCLP